jgi:spore germination protein GerM
MECDDGFMTGETIRDLLKPLIGKSGSISMVVSQVGQIGLAATENKKLTGIEIRPDGLVRLERESGWVVIDPGQVVAVVWDGEPATSAGQFL